MTSSFDQPFLNTSGCCFEHTSGTSSNFGILKKQASGDLTLEDRKEKQEIDTLLSDAMNNLTFEEREKQQKVLHGVDDALSEEAYVIENALIELDNSVAGIKFGTVYETAERMNPNYVQDRAFRIMFLRGKRYDVKEAAEQMLKFFEVKQDLFGMEKLTKDITVEDLDEDDLACLRTGWLQFSGKDRPGRAVMNHFLGLRAFQTLENELRVKFFMLMDLLKDEDVQLRGAIGLNFAVGQLRDSKNGAGYMENMVVSDAIPLHTAAIHLCCNQVSQYIITKVAIASFPQKLRSRFKLHFGSSLECQYHLSTYGISRENLPIVPGTNKVDMTRHLHWCRSHFAMPSIDTMNSFLEVAPTQKDVLYLGAKRSNNGGNLYLRNLVAEWSRTYDSGANDIKRCVVNDIIDAVHKTGGRFLNQSECADSVWLELPKDEIRVKISQAFRNHRRKLNGRGRRKWN